MRARNLVIALGVGAAVGLTVFGVMVARVTTIERISDPQARARFEQIRTGFADPTPKLSIDPEGGFVWQAPPSQVADNITTLQVMAYRGPVKGLIEAAIPMWFLRLKEPAIRFALGKTGVDLDDYGINLDRLASYGPAIIVDELHEDGDHVLIWTEPKGN